MHDNPELGAGNAYHGAFGHRFQRGDAFVQIG